ncbi:MAG: hypothetical protein LBT46_06850, partial [Planctomycetaceae bacterium]|nr:hypothetical protein [Planctomycetaceae bacterium]
MSDDTYNTQSPPQPNPAPFQSGYIAKDFNKIPDRNNPSMSDTAQQQQTYVPPPYQPAYAQMPPQPAYQQTYVPPPPPNYPPYHPVYMQAPPPQRTGCFGFFLRSLATVCVVIVCFFLLMLGGLFCIGAGVGALMSMSEEGAFKFVEVPEKHLSEAVIEGNAEANKKIAV